MFTSCVPKGPNPKQYQQTDQQKLLMIDKLIVMSQKEHLLSFLVSFNMALLQAKKEHAPEENACTAG